MSERIEIKPTEAGIVRVFAVDIAADEIAAFTARNGSWPMADALGASTLDAQHVEVFDASDLAGLGLAGYLADGHAIPDAQLDEMRGQLAAQTGVLMVVTSRAFQGAGQILTPRAPLRLVATFQEDRAPVSFDSLPDASARMPAEAPETEGEKTRKKPSDAAMSGRVATVVLLVLALLVLVMVWVAA